MNFGLDWRDRRVAARQTPRHFLDYIVDGESLYERHGADFIGPLGWLSPEEDERSARRLLGTEPPDVDGRVALYICPEDADLLCGAITAIVERDGEQIIWRDVALSQFDYAEGRWHHDPTGFSEWRELCFAATSYRKAIAGRPKP
jgi:hypothetical protein